MKKIIQYFTKNRNIIYYSLITLFIIMGLIYAIKGYYYHQDMGQIKSGNDLLSVIFTPFVLAIIRFLMVVCFGLFLATIIIAIPLRRVKVMQFEIEFAEKATEIAKIQDKQFNQLHFLENVLKEDNYFIGKFHQKDGIPYREVIEHLFHSYEVFFNDELKTNLHFEWIDAGNGENFDDKRLKRLMDTLKTQENDNVLIRNRTIFGSNILMLYQEELELGAELYILLSSSEYEFTDFDVKIIQSLLEIARIICDSISMIPPDQT
ncbi:hypothetical protein [Gracilibacillus phocaeensis]|uniref:hypothetical protein n=1 Tax=Gracilibacillus phocaeensis TaxID=2042304 RepID=UPI00102F420F|nr:hypothetical protein [Gracilibacillus phocaeensis]